MEYSEELQETQELLDRPIFQLGLAVIFLTIEGEIDAELEVQTALSHLCKAQEILDKLINRE